MLETADKAVANALHFISSQKHFCILAVTVFCLMLYLPGIAHLPVTDRDEARFTQSSKQMIETGNYIDIRLQDVPRYKKPIGIYWLQSATAGVAQFFNVSNNSIWPYRLPSLFAAIGSVLLTFWIANAVFGRFAALMAAAFFATSLMLCFEAHIAKSDAALTFAITMMQGALYQIYVSRHANGTKQLAFLFWLGLGLSILIKGPVGPAMALTTIIPILIIDKRRGWLSNFHWRWGLPVLLVMTLPWFIAIGISSNGTFFKNSLGQDFAGKLQSGQESHWGPPGFYFILFWVTFWPASLFVNLEALKRLRLKRLGRRGRFLFAWIVPYWLLIELIPTKLPHYVLPLYPAIAIALAFRSKSYLSHHDARWRSRLSIVIWSLIGAVQIALLIALAWLFEESPSILIGLMISVLAIFIMLTALSSWKRYGYVAIGCAVASAIMFYVTAFQIVLPAAQPIWISSQTAEMAKDLRGCGNDHIAFAGYYEPSAVFMNGTATKLIDTKEAARSLGSKDVGLAFVNWKRRIDFEQTYMQQNGTAPVLMGCVDGININGRGSMRLQVYASASTINQPNCSPNIVRTCRNKSEVRWRRILDTPF